MSADFCSFCSTRCNCGEGGKDQVAFISDELYIICDNCLDRTDLACDKDGNAITIRSILEPAPQVNLILETTPEPADPRDVGFGFMPPHPNWNG